MPDFINGRELSERYFWDAAYPILRDQFPGLKIAAALIGPGSEVLGFDTPLSRDHHWGPRFQLFLRAEDYSRIQKPLDDALRQHLPLKMLGYSTNLTDPQQDGSRMLEDIDIPPVKHFIEICTVEQYFQNYLGYNPAIEPTLAEWLSFSEHRLLSVTAGKIFLDETGDLTHTCQVLNWYPDEIWKYLLACEWEKIAQEEPFVGRTGSVEDELGSHLITARLVHTIMRLCFLMEKRYPPYSKWFGTGFAGLKCAPVFKLLLQSSLGANNWISRETHLSEAYRQLVRLHNALGLTEPLPEEVSFFYNRPYRVIHAGLFSQALHKSIHDPQISALPLIGSVNTFSVTTDFLENIPNAQFKQMWSVLF